MIDNMPTVIITTLRRKTMEVLKHAEHQPILITRYGNPCLVLMPVDHYNRLMTKEF